MKKCVFCGCNILTNELKQFNYVEDDHDGNGHYWYRPAVLITNVNGKSQRLGYGELQFYDGTGEKPIPAMCCGNSACQKKRKAALRGVASDSAMRESLANIRSKNKKAKRQLRGEIEKGGGLK
jgi:hypothetical protein